VDKLYLIPTVLSLFKSLHVFSIGTDSHADNVIGTDSHADNVIGTDSHPDNVIGTDSHADNVIGTDSHADNVIGTDSHADNVIATPPQISFAHSQIRKKQTRNNRVTLSNPKFLSVIFKIPGPISQKTQCLFTTKSNLLILLT